MWKERSFAACRMTRDFSSRYDSMLAPTMRPDASKLMRINLPYAQMQFFKRAKGIQAHESRRVVILYRLRITERLQNRIRQQ